MRLAADPDMDADAITESLEQVAERCADPTAAVYDILFSRHPEMRTLFVRDVSGAVRGQMLNQAIEIVLDHVGARYFSRNFVASEVINHDGLGVPPDVFASFFGVMRDAFRIILGPEWTPRYDMAWRELVGDLSAFAGAEALTS